MTDAEVFILAPAFVWGRKGLRSVEERRDNDQPKRKIEMSKSEAR